MNNRVQYLLQHLIWTVALSFCLSAHAAINSSDFPYSKELLPSDSSNKKTASCEFDEEIFSQTENNYANLRIFNDQNTETPFLVRPRKQKKEITKEYEVPLEKMELKSLADNEIELLFRKTTKKTIDFPEVIVFHTSLKNYEKHVSVQGSLDGSIWEDLTEDKPIFDYSRFIDIHNNRVELKPNRSLFYKIIFSNISEARQSPFTRITRDVRKDQQVSEVTRNDFTKVDFRIERVQFLARKTGYEESSRIERLYPVSNMNIDNDLEKQKTIITFEMSRVPLTSLILITDNINFSRNVTVEGAKTADGEDRWQILASENISRIDIGQIKRDKTKIDLNQPCRYQHYRLTISNLDNSPLKISGIEARGEVHEALFFHEPASKYSMLYGGKNKKSPRYDISTVLKNTKWPDTDVYVAGDEKPNPDYSPSIQWFGNQVMLIAAILFVAIILVWLISKTIKNIEISTEQ